MGVRGWLTAAGGFVLGSCAMAVAQQATKARPTYVDPVRGFSIESPRFPQPAAVPLLTPVMFFAPAENGFASNVNVTIQPKKSTLKAYRDETLAYLKEQGIKVRAQHEVTVAGREALELDYDGESQGKSMRFLQLAVFDLDRVLLVTCTAPSATFGKYEPEFRASLASLKILPR